MPPELRTELIKQCGVVRLTVGPKSAQVARVRLMSLFRQSDATLREVTRQANRLSTDGMTGTEAERRLLSDRLARLDTVAHVSAE